MSAGRPAITVVIVTHNSAGHIGATLTALAPQLGSSDEIVVVDNASSDDTLAVVGASGSDVRCAGAGANLGFAAACHMGARTGAAPLLLFLNPDALPAESCLDRLRAVAAAQPSWAAWQALVTLPGGRAVNSDGGVTHYLGFGWAGGLGRPVTDGVGQAHVSFASGAALMIRRTAWEATEGFDESYFMYGEDLDLSLRLWLTGSEVGIEPRARVEHDYEFAKGAQKWFFLERNRWSTVIADYPGALLGCVLPALLAFELALLPVAARQGWLGAKLRAQAAVIRSLPALLARRRRVQASRRVSVDAFARRLTASLDSPFLGRATGMPALANGQRAYWRAARIAAAAIDRRLAPPDRR